MNWHFYYVGFGTNQCYCSLIPDYFISSWALISALFANFTWRKMISFDPNILDVHSQCIRFKLALYHIANGGPYNMVYMLLMVFEKRRIGWKCLNWKLKWDKWLIECFCLIFILDSYFTFFNWLGFEDKLSFRSKVPPIKILRKPTVGTLTLVKTEVILEIKNLNVIFNGLDLA